MTLRGKVVLVVICLLLAGCGSSQAGGRAQPALTEPTEQSTSASAPAPFTTIVSVKDFDPDCQKVKCWLPTQFGPELVERESVSREERVPEDPRGPQVGWPMDGDEVEVLCVIKGGPYRNQLGQLINDWYGIRVPVDKLEPGSADRAKKAPDGNGYLAYVGISWLKDAGKRAPAC